MTVIMKAAPVKESMFKDWRPLTKKVAIFSNKDDFASAIYVRNKKKFFEEKEIECEVIDISNFTDAELMNKCTEVSEEGIPNMVQLPLPKQLTKFFVCCEFTPSSTFLDMDGLNINTQGCFYSEPGIGNSPCTPLGILCLLKYYFPLDEITNKNVVVIGRSSIVGRPVARLLENKLNATVTICHSKTKDISFYTKNADIIVVAVGKKGFLTKDMVSSKAIKIDVGINRGDDGKICGDCDFEALNGFVKGITPVPGGVGPMTVASLVFKMGETEETKW